MSTPATLKASVYGYIGHLTRVYKEMEVLMFSYENLDAVLKWCNRLCEVFKTFTEKVGLYNLRAEKEVPEFESTLATIRNLRVELTSGWMEHPKTNQVFLGSPILYIVARVKLRFR